MVLRSRAAACPRCLRMLQFSVYPPCQRRRYASVQAIASSAAASDIPPPEMPSTITPAAIPQAMQSKNPPVVPYHPSQPPSHRRPESRRTQLHRYYTSLIRSTPLMVVFQHLNLTALEWSALRRELAVALRAVDTDAENARSASETASASQDSSPPALADAIKLQVINSGIFGSALGVVEHWSPPKPSLQNSTDTPPAAPETSLSRAAHAAAVRARRNASAPSAFETLISTGPIALLTFPAVTPVHLRAALSILSPQAPKFPAPKRKLSPLYYEPPVQGAVNKLVLLGARVENQTMSVDGIRWVGGIEGGLDGLRAQIVHALQSIGGSLVNTLDGANRSVWWTLESRRMQMEDMGKTPESDSTASPAKDA